MDRGIWISVITNLKIVGTEAVEHIGIKNPMALSLTIPTAAWGETKPGNE